MSKPGRDNARVIMHLDMDAFFVNVELLENPSLRGKPIIVAPTGPRSVVCSASYEARAHGVHSGMPLSCALSEVPHATVLPLRADYRYYSRAVMGILRDLSPLVEQVSVDEAFVDLTGAYRHGQDPVQLAQRARERIAGELSLPSSAGVAPNKLLAKMASTGSKPNGLWVAPGLGAVGRGLEKHKAFGRLRNPDHCAIAVPEHRVASGLFRHLPRGIPLDCCEGH